MIFLLIGTWHRQASAQNDCPFHNNSLHKSNLRTRVCLTLEWTWKVGVLQCLNRQKPFPLFYSLTSVILQSYWTWQSQWLSNFARTVCLMTESSPHKQAQLKRGLAMVFKLATEMGEWVILYQIGTMSWVLISCQLSLNVPNMTKKSDHLRLLSISLKTYVNSTHIQLRVWSGVDVAI